MVVVVVEAVVVAVFDAEDRGGEGGGRVDAVAFGHAEDVAFGVAVAEFAARRAPGVEGGVFAGVGRDVAFGGEVGGVGAADVGFHLDWMVGRLEGTCRLGSVAWKFCWLGCVAR